MKKSHLLLSIITLTLAGNMVLAEPAAPSSTQWLDIARADSTTGAKTIKNDAKEFFEKADKDTIEMNRKLKTDSEKAEQKIKKDSEKIYNKSKDEAKNIDNKTKQEYNSLKDSLK